VIRIFAGQLRHRPTRVLALLLAVVVATTAFTVLTGTSETGRLQTTGVVSQNFRSAYDILVRPQGSQTDLEREQGIVRPNFLSGQFGGITMQQYGQIKSIPGVEVAAPIAMIGYMLPEAFVPIRWRTDPRVAQELFRLRRTWVEDQGLTRAKDATSYSYVTNRKLTAVYSPDTTTEVFERVGHRGLLVCKTPGTTKGPWDPVLRAGVGCHTTAKSSDRSLQARRGSLTWGFYWPFPMMIAAIDPVQEARLAGLDHAITKGRYLRGSDKASDSKIPVMVPTSPYVDQRLIVSVDRLGEGLARQVPGHPLQVPDPKLEAAPGAVVKHVTISAQSAYQHLLTTWGAGHLGGVYAYWTPQATTYDTGSNGILVPRTTTNADGAIWRDFYGSYVDVPKTQSDVQFRKLSQHLMRPDIKNSPPVMHSVGEYDPSKLAGFSSLTVPLETYTAPRLSAGDAASSAALGGKDLLPGGNMGGYLQAPPMILTSLSSVSRFASAADAGSLASAPLSAIRVRVAGVTGPDPVSRERVRVVAEEIAKTTGLQVDITVGSSPSPKLIDLAAGRYGRPELTLKENWTKKGVAVAILDAVDRKSLALFVLILLVCGMFVLNAASASVRARRAELGVLACVGWSRPRLFGLILGELAVIGLVAGLIGALLSWPLARALGVDFSVQRALIAVPAAVLVAAAAGVGPARRASRADPLAAVRPTIAQGHRTWTPRGITALAVQNALRVPGRSLLAAGSLAVGVCAVTLLLAVSIAFRGVLVGSLLGDAVAVQIRGVDYIAAVTTVVLGMIAVADVLYLNIRERSAELTTLRVVGWRDAQLSRLVTTEGLTIGAFGAFIGAAVGVGLATAFAGTFPTALLGTAVLIIAAATLLAGVAALVPAAILRRMPNAEALADE